ncbi:MAG: hypothetical protein ACYC7E_16230 [Armatimonadota bacterium]
MRLLYLILFVPAMAVLFAGCARFPAGGGGGVAPARTLLSEITVLGSINPTYYYFLAINTDGDPDHGPVPIVTGPELGNGWGTLAGFPPEAYPIEPPFYVEYHNGLFQEYQNGQPIGQPYRGEVTQNGTGLLVEIDLVDLGAVVSDRIQLNWITNEKISTNPSDLGIAKEYDGFGPQGTNYIDITSLLTTQSFYSGENGIVAELPDDSTSVADIDMIGWHVEVKINQ